VVAAKRLNLLPSKQQQEAVSERERVCVCDQKANTILCTKPAPKQQQIGGAPNPKKTGARERRSKSRQFLYELLLLLLLLRCGGILGLE
jgi:hypothetical protein